MKLRGFLVLLILGMVVVYFVWFTKTGNKTNLQQTVDRFNRTKVELTQVNLGEMGKAVMSFMANEGKLPDTLDELRRARIVTAGGYIDAWGRSVKYERLSDITFKLTSAGPDGVFGNADDLSKDY